MNWNNHSNLEGTHAFLSASKYNWINYDEARLIEAYRRFKAAAKGTELHEFAAKCIELRQKLPKSDRTLNLYVNDALKYHMRPEQKLYFSSNCYGTADAISFENGMLRIHDLKTGENPAHIEQLMIYAALFCMEYGRKPKDIDMELRLYQNDEVLCHNPEAIDIDDIMQKILAFDKILKDMEEEEQ